MKYPHRVIRPWAAGALCLVALVAANAFAAEFKAGFAKRDITPTKPVPMWGYGARHALLSEGVLSHQFAKVVVIDTGTDKLAIMGLDIGRSPTKDMMPNIRKAVKEKSGIEFVMISGSHTHHGPVIELKDVPGKGKGTFDDAVAYSREFEKNIIDAINEAAASVQPARIGWGSAMVEWNHNRTGTTIQPKPVDHELGVIRFDDLAGKPIALVVNFAAHPTTLSIMDRRLSAEYPGYMQDAVEAGLATNCLFMQGASGDLSPEKKGLETDAYGKAVGEDVIKIAQGIETKVPAEPSIKGKYDTFVCDSRMDLWNPMVQAVLKQGFFPEMIAMLDELPDKRVHPDLITVLVNGELALVGGSGEFFCNHSIRLKERARGVKLFLFGYCNGHQMYFPTIEQTSEGGYGCDPLMSWVALGTGEEMMDRALVNLYTMMGKYDRQAAVAPGGFGGAQGQ